MAKINVYLTDRQPVQVEPEAWKKVASASWHNGQVECQATRKNVLSVRMHSDGRVIVYGWKTSAYENDSDVYRGELGEISNVVELLRKVGDDLEFDEPEIIQMCIQDLPPVELE